MSEVLKITETRLDVGADQPEIKQVFPLQSSLEQYHADLLNFWNNFPCKKIFKKINLLLCCVILKLELEIRLDSFLSSLDRLSEVDVRRFDSDVRLFIVLLKLNLWEVRFPFACSIFIFIKNFEWRFASVVFVRDGSQNGQEWLRKRQPFWGLSPKKCWRHKDFVSNI